MSIAQTLDDYAKQVRLPAALAATLAVLSNVLAAHVIATEGWPDWLVLVPQLAAAALLCWSGLVLKDAFDLAQGRTEQPKQPLTSAMVANWSGWAVGGGLAAVGLACAAIAGGSSFRVALTLLVAMVAYYGFLRDSLLAPVILGTFRFLNWMLGLAAVPVVAGGTGLAVPVFLYATAMAILTGTQPRGADLGTIKFTAVVLGLAALMVIQFVVGGTLEQPLVLAPLALAVFGLGYALWRLSRDGSPAAVQTLVGQLTAGVIALDAMLLLGTNHWLWAVAVAALLLPLVPGLLPGRRPAA